MVAPVALTVNVNTVLLVKDLVPVKQEIKVRVVPVVLIVNVSTVLLAKDLVLVRLT